MSINLSGKKILWAEGTLLTQQHLQQWDKMQSAKDTFWYYLNKQKPIEGFLSLDVDSDLLVFGIVRINAFEAVSKEGEIIRFVSNPSEAKYLELALNTIEWVGERKQGDILSVYISIPIGSGSVGVSGYSNNNMTSARWIAEYTLCADEMDNEREQEVLFGALNISLLIEKSIDFEIKKDKNQLMIALKIIYLGQSGYALSKEFIPPILQIGASQLFLSLLNNFLDYLSFLQNSIILKIKIIIKRYNREKDWNQSDRAKEGMLRELLRFVTLLKYHVRSSIENPSVNPESVIQFIEKSLIECTALSRNFYQLSEIKCIKQEDLYQRVKEVISLFKETIKEILPVSKRNIMLKQGGESWLCSDILDKNTIENEELFLSVDFNESEILSERFLKEIKISGANIIHQIITQALPGIPLFHCNKKAFLMDENERNIYFQIGKSGEHWDSIKENSSLCVFVPQSFSAVNIKLFSVVNCNEDE